MIPTSMTTQGPDLNNSLGWAHLLEHAGLSRPSPPRPDHLAAAQVTPARARRLRKAAEQTQQKEAEAAAAAEAAAEGASATQQERFIEGSWGPPQLQDQFTNAAYRDTFKLLAPQVYVFDIAQAKDLAALNELMARTQPVSAPTLQIRSMQGPLTSSVSDALRVVIVACEILYKQLKGDDSAA